jgi:hypothetical protein
MSYHIVSIDSPKCSLTCRDGQLICRTEEGEKKLPLEDVASIIITSFSASIHSQLFLGAAKQGVALIICETFRPVSLVLPANRSTDTLLTRALRGVDDAVGVGDLDAKALEETLVNGVEEGLLFAEVVDGGGGALDGDVKVVELFDKVVAAKGAGRQGGDDLLDFLRDDVALGEIGDVENLAEDALGQHVLNDHLLDGGF